MSGDRTKASIWEDADIYLDFSTTAPTPADTFTAWGTGWESAGLLSGSDGFEESRDDDSSEFWAWGSVMVRKTHSKHKRSVKFVALEDNAATFKLLNPGSTRGTAGANGVTQTSIKVPVYTEFKIGFETVDGDKVRRRIATAVVDGVGAIKSTESDLEAYEVTVLIIPDANTKELWVELTGPATAPTP